MDNMRVYIGDKVKILSTGKTGNVISVRDWKQHLSCIFNKRKRKEEFRKNLANFGEGFAKNWQMLSVKIGSKVISVINFRVKVVEVNHKIVS